MSKMTIAHLGVIVFAICLSTQVVSLNNTDTGGGNSTLNPNVTTVATDVSTAATGAAVTPHAGAFSLLIPAFLAASLLHCYC